MRRLVTTHALKRRMPVPQIKEWTMMGQSTGWFCFANGHSGMLMRMLAAGTRDMKGQPADSAVHDGYNAPIADKLDPAAWANVVGRRLKVVRSELGHDLSSSCYVAVLRY